VISRVTRIPFLLVFFGVVGGVAAFGLLGLFIGPLLLSVALTLWREWTEEEEREAGRRGNGETEKQAN
ncbi:MAG: AI-2E family transporter, partial [Nitrospirae bacterium]|nr:AI-2E family transporter [Nitrospirota bacterium]